MPRWPHCCHISISPFLATFLRLLCLLLQILLVPQHRCFFLCSCISPARGCCCPSLVCLAVLGWLESKAGASLLVLELRCQYRCLSMTDLSHSVKREQISALITVHSRNADEFAQTCGRPCGHLSSSGFLAFGENSRKVNNGMSLLVHLAHGKHQLSRLLPDFWMKLQKIIITSYSVVYISERTLSGTKPPLLHVFVFWCKFFFKLLIKCY